MSPLCRAFINRILVFDFGVGVFYIRVSPFICKTYAPYIIIFYINKLYINLSYINFIGFTKEFYR